MRGRRGNGKKNEVGGGGIVSMVRLGATQDRSAPGKEGKKEEEKR